MNPRKKLRRYGLFSLSRGPRLVISTGHTKTTLFADTEEEIASVFEALKREYKEQARTSRLVISTGRTKTTLFADTDEEIDAAFDSLTRESKEQSRTFFLYFKRHPVRKKRNTRT